MGDVVDIGRISTSRRGTAWSQKEAYEAQKMRNRGISTAEIAAILGRTERAVANKTCCISPRRGNRQPLTDADYAEISRLWGEGVSMAEIGRRIKRGHSAIRSAKAFLGLPDRVQSTPAATAMPAQAYVPLAPQLGIRAIRDCRGVMIPYLPSVHGPLADQVSPPA